MAATGPSWRRCCLPGGWWMGLQHHLKWLCPRQGMVWRDDSDAGPATGRVELVHPSDCHPVGCVDREAVRGEGHASINSNGDRFMAQCHSAHGSRDIITSRAIACEVLANVVFILIWQCCWWCLCLSWLRHMGKDEKLWAEFFTWEEAHRLVGIDADQPIPVRPTVSLPPMGGIPVNTDGRRSGADSSRATPRMCLCSVQLTGEYPLPEV